MIWKRVKLFFHLAFRLEKLSTWQKYKNDMEKWYRRERLLGMTPGEEKYFREKDQRIFDILKGKR